MKYNAVILTLLLVILSYANIQAGVTVSEKVKIGIKYDSTAVKSVSLKSADGFFVSIEDGEDLVSLSETNLTVEKAQVNDKETYMVVVKGGFEDYQAADTYAQNNGDLTVYYEDSVYYAVREKIMTEGDAKKLLEEIAIENAYFLSPNEKRIRIGNPKNGKTLMVFSGQNGEQLEISANAKGNLFLDSTEYRGSLVFVRQSGSDMTVISKLGMDEYLYSVTPSEIPASSGMEALKTQAVCARTYATENSNRHSSMGFQLCNSQHCQMYKGVSSEHKNTNQAVDATHGEVLTYNGKIITAVYSASCGGETESVENVWGTPYPYLKGVKDPYCKEIQWETSLDFASIAKSLQAKGYDFGAIRSIEITEKTSTGRVLQLKITGEKQTKTFGKEQARTILGLRSQMYDIVPQNAFRILTAGGFLYWNLSGREIINETGLSKIEGNTITVLTAENGETVKKQIPTISESFVIKGRGNGHGVGMCQNGAMGLAEHGYSYEEILKHYYTGVEITTGE